MGEFNLGAMQIITIVDVSGNDDVAVKGPFVEQQKDRRRKPDYPCTHLLCHHDHRDILLFFDSEIVLVRILLAADKQGL